MLCNLQRVTEHNSLNSSVGKHIFEMLSKSKPNMFSKFEWYHLQNADNQNKKKTKKSQPFLNIQADSIRAKLFKTYNMPKKC